MSRWIRAREADAHRPWPAPDAPWLGHMSWTDVLLLHWPVAPETLQRHLPPDVALDLWKGKAWLTVTVHGMRRVGVRNGPWLPPFAELNVRTYATAEGKPGVVFLALHAPNRIVVAGGRILGLPYWHSLCALHRSGRRRDVTCRAGDTRFSASYRPLGTRREDALDLFLSERYCLYAQRLGRTWRLEVQHRPWPLEEVRFEGDWDLARRFGAKGGPTRAAFARRLDVIAWPPRPVPRTATTPQALPPSGVPFRHS